MVQTQISKSDAHGGCQRGRVTTFHLDADSTRSAHQEQIQFCALKRSPEISSIDLERLQNLLDDSVYMIRQLQPWHDNLAKRQVKAPKIYLRDTDHDNRKGDFRISWFGARQTWVGHLGLDIVAPGTPS